MAKDPLSPFRPAVREWFRTALGEPTRAQALAFGPIAGSESTLLLAPTGSGKTLAAFLAALDRLAFTREPPKAEACRVLYVSPLKALAVDIERNLRAPLAGIVETACRRGEDVRVPIVGVRTGDTPTPERAKMLRAPPDVLITTPESLYLLLTSGARVILSHVETVIIDEIHALAPSKRGAHLFLSLERLEAVARAGAGAASAHRALGDAAAARRDRAAPRRLRATESRARSPSSTRGHRKTPRPHDRGPGRGHGAPRGDRRGPPREAPREGDRVGAGGGRSGGGRSGRTSTRGS